MNRRIRTPGARHGRRKDQHAGRAGFLRAAARARNWAVREEDAHIRGCKGNSRRKTMTRPTRRARFHTSATPVTAATPGRTFDRSAPMLTLGIDRIPGTYRNDQAPGPVRATLVVMISTSPIGTRGRLDRASGGLRGTDSMEGTGAPGSHFLGTCGIKDRRDERMAASLRGALVDAAEKKHVTTPQREIGPTNAKRNLRRFVRP
ncbi:MAG: hypothetical protein JWO83_512 [Caulobacteraceae bacterium]|nr:hypothetical protein [Caulobacteraceae bacterium]